MTQPRFDVYGSLHKGIRSLMTDLMYELGKSDVNNISELTALGEKLGYLWDILYVHAQGEEEFIFPHLKIKDEKFYMKLKKAHEKFEKDAGSFREAFKELLGIDIEAAEKQLRITKFTKRYNTFVSEYFSHMQDEELEANSILWGMLDDEELMDILSNMSQKPTVELREYFLPYLLRATNPNERVGVLMGMRRSMSESVFNGTLKIARTSLTESDWQKLKLTLDNLIQLH
ncbi:MAG: hemerythrin domain-containing protein [Candidatus Thorarchaeota archaeon]